MPNPVLLLTDPQTTLTALQQVIAPSTKAVFLVLGNSPQHTELAHAAQLKQHNWWLPVQVTQPELVLPYLATLTNKAKSPQAPKENWFAICISMNSHIIAVYNNGDKKNILLPARPCL